MSRGSRAWAAGTVSPNLGLGLGFAVLSASGFGFITTLARLSYDGGGSPQSVIAARYLAAVVVLGLVVAWRRQGFGVARRDWGRLGVMTLGVFGLTIGYLNAVAHIPVSLAALLFYTFPLIVAGALPLIERRGPGLRQAAAFVLAFLGLGLALGPSFDSLDPRGVAWALTAAVSGAAIFLSSGPLLARNSVFTVAFQVNLLGGLLVGLLAGLQFGGGLALTGSGALPATQAGWLALGGASLCFIVAMLAQFTALRRAGALRCAIVFNLEPLVSIVFAAVLLGERLTPLQLAGVALVLGALVLSALERSR